MTTIEIFSAGCPCCTSAIQAIRSAAGKNDTIHVRDMQDAAVAADAAKHGINRVPAVVVNGKLADCCASGAPNIGVLKGLGLGA